MARMTLEDALRELEFLFEAARYPSYKESWEIVREYAREGERHRQAEGSDGAKESETEPKSLGASR